MIGRRPTTAGATFAFLLVASCSLRPQPPISEEAMLACAPGSAKASCLAALGPDVVSGKWECDYKGKCVQIAFYNDNAKSLIFTSPLGPERYEGLDVGFAGGRVEIVFLARITPSLPEGLPAKLARVFGRAATATIDRGYLRDYRWAVRPDAPCGEKLTAGCVQLSVFSDDGTGAVDFREGTEELYRRFVRDLFR